MEIYTIPMLMYVLIMYNTGARQHRQHPLRLGGVRYDLARFSNRKPRDGRMEEPLVAAILRLTVRA